MKKKGLPGLLCAAALFAFYSFFFSSSALAMRDHPLSAGHREPAAPVSADRPEERSPYGSSERGEYGEKRAVSSEDEARQILKRYFSKRGVRIGKITEKELYFEAEIRDRGGNLVDIVIVDKRTGRIRSIY